METKEIILGRNPVLEYIKQTSDGSAYRLYISSSAHGKIINTIVSVAKEKKISIEKKDKGFFTSLSSSSKHQGVALEIPPHKQKQADESMVLEKAFHEKSVLVLMDQVTDPHNAGSIIRSAEALGCSGVIIPKSRSAGLNPTVVKSSAGATAHIPVITVANIAAFLDRSREMGFWTIGTSDHGSEDLSKLRDIKPAIIIIGSEGTGMRRLTEEKCDHIIRIPLRGSVSSLNASVAAGIVLYEAMKDPEK